MVLRPSLGTTLVGGLFIAVYALFAMDGHRVWGAEASDPGAVSGHRLNQMGKDASVSGDRNEVEELHATIMRLTDFVRETQLEQSRLRETIDQMKGELTQTNNQFAEFTRGIKVGAIFDGQPLPIDDPKMWRIVLFPKTIGIQENIPDHNLDNALLALEACVENDGRTVRVKELYKYSPDRYVVRSLYAYYIAIPAEQSSNQSNSIECTVEYKAK